MDQLSSHQKKQLHQVADHLLEIYQTLAKMRYLDPAAIQPGPHDISHLLPLYQEYGLDGSIIYLYSILPYINNRLTDKETFFHGGEFINFLDPEDLEQSRDPFYASFADENFSDEDGPYMRPWVTPLSKLGNHGSVIIYDASRSRCWIIDQEGWTSTDIALQDVDEGKQGVNRNSFEHIPSRDVFDVLRDINSWFLSLEEFPEYEWELDLRALYRKYGWPDDFDGDGFDAEMRMIKNSY